ncbi:MAG: SHS2 domain-containing protein [Sulfitobacter sp.]|jgi:SHS2 domain-containing protein
MPRIGDWLKRRAEPVETPALRLQSDYRDFERSVVLYCNFRSGSHMLKLTLDRVAGIKSTPELLNPAVVGEGGFNIREFVDKDPDATVLSEGASLTERYMNAVFSTVSSERRMLLDIKYSQAFTFGVEREFKHDVIVPTMILELSKRKVPFLHLVRRDAVAQSLSKLVAAASGEYFRQINQTPEAATPAPPQSYRFSPALVHEESMAQRRIAQHASAVLKAIGARHLPIFYEDLVGPDIGSELRRILTFIDHYADIPADFAAATLNQNSSSRVKNLAEIRAYIQARDPDLASSSGTILASPST